LGCGSPTQRHGSPASSGATLEADAFQTTACWWLSLAALAGVGPNGLFGWWWADPLAALVIATLIAREARHAWRGEACC
jgi:divalent metal cation (Fe/Co/Zn/Cd) transporter